MRHKFWHLANCYTCKRDKCKCYNNYDNLCPISRTVIEKEKQRNKERKKVNA